MLEKEAHESENRYLELYEEYNMMNDDMHELQQQLEEAGFGDNESEEGFEGKTSKSNSLLKIPGKGGKKIMSILKKSRKMIKNTIKESKTSIQNFIDKPKEVEHPEMIAGQIPASKQEKEAEKQVPDHTPITKSLDEEEKPSKKDKKKKDKITDDQLEQMKEQKKQIDDLRQKVKELEKGMKEQDFKSNLKDKEIKHYQDIATDMAR